MSGKLMAGLGAVMAAGVVLTLVMNNGLPPTASTESIGIDGGGGASPGGVSATRLSRKLADANTDGGGVDGVVARGGDVDGSVTMRAGKMETESPIVLALRMSLESFGK